MPFYCCLKLNNYHLNLDDDDKGTEKWQRNDGEDCQWNTNICGTKVSLILFSWYYVDCKNTLTLHRPTEANRSLVHSITICDQARNRLLLWSMQCWLVKGIVVGGHPSLGISVMSVTVYFSHSPSSSSSSLKCTLEQRCGSATTVQPLNFPPVSHRKVLLRWGITRCSLSN